MRFHLQDHLHHINQGLITCVIIGILFLKAVSCQVIEVDDTFSEKRGEHSWLLKFYAPWCGHCRKLEPVYHEVSLALKGSGIFVAKVDATRFPSMASDYGVRGYPTILFLQGSRSYTHRGDRSKQGIVEFARRAHGPPVKLLSSVGNLRDVLNLRSDDVFFLYVGSKDPHAPLYSKYTSIADRYAVQGYFYAGEQIVLPTEIKPDHEPTVLVFKDGRHYEFPHGDSGTSEELETWVNEERYGIFPLINGGGLNSMADMNKKMVMVITEENELENHENINLYKDLTKSLAEKKYDTFHKHLQFLWMDESDTASSIIMAYVPVPTIIVLDPETQFYYLYENERSPNGLEVSFSEQSLEKFLLSVLDGKATPYGGTSFFQRLKRLFYDIWTTILSIYETSGWLALVVFGIPTAVISIVVYALCCMEPMETSEEDEDDEDYLEENEALVDEQQMAAAEESKPNEDGKFKSE